MHWGHAHLGRGPYCRHCSLLSRSSLSERTSVSISLACLLLAAGLGLACAGQGASRPRHDNLSQLVGEGLRFGATAKHFCTQLPSKNTATVTGPVLSQASSTSYTGLEQHVLARHLSSSSAAGPQLSTRAALSVIVQSAKLGSSPHASRRSNYAENEVAHAHMRRTALVDTNQAQAQSTGVAGQSSSGGAANSAQNAPPWFDAQACPSWMQDYITWHKATKGTLGAKYLVYECNKFGTNCYFGLGDRFRGMLFLARLAESMKRVLLIDIPSPLPFTKLFEPATFDWTKGDLHTGNGPDMRYINFKILSYLVMNGTLHAETAKFLVTEGNNEQDWKGIPGHPPQPWPGESGAHCMWRALFRPSVKVQQATDLRLQQMNLAVGMPYVAIHIRLGGMIGEHTINRFDTLTALHHGLRCGRALAKQNGIGQQKLVIVTDNMQLKYMLLSGLIVGATTSRVMPVHTGTTGRMALHDDLYIQTVADMGILAEARFLVADGGGGFGLQARFWGPSDNFKVVFRELRDCIARNMKNHRQHMAARLMLPPGLNFSFDQPRQGFGWIQVPYVHGLNHVQ